MRALRNLATLLLVLACTGCGWVGIALLVTSSSSSSSGGGAPSEEPELIFIDVVGRDGPIQLTYELFNEPGESVDVFVEFSLDGMDTFQPVSTQPPTVVVPGDSGLTVVYIWDSKAEPEVGESGFLDAFIRFTPRDNVADESGDEVLSIPFVLGNDAPVIEDAFTIGNGQNIVLEVFISDTTLDLVGLELDFETAQHSRQPLTLVSGNADGLNAAPPPDGTEHTFVWGSALDIPGQTLLASLYIRPEDSEPGIETTLTVQVDNNQRPSVTAIRPAGDNSGDIGISYIVRDEESQPVSVAVEYSVDGGPFLPATEVVGPPSSGTSGLASLPNDGVGNENVHRFVWDAFADVGFGSNQQVRIRIEPTDTSVGFAGVTEPPFVIQHGPFRSAGSVDADQGPAGILQPQRAATGDFDKNGLPDVIVPFQNLSTTPESSFVAVALQVAIDDFAFDQPLVLPGQARWATVGDYNDDRKLDFAIAFEEALIGVIVFLQNDVGFGFTPLPNIMGPPNARAEDLVTVAVGPEGEDRLVVSYGAVGPMMSPLRVLRYDPMANMGMGGMVDEPMTFQPNPNAGMVGTRRLAVGDWNGDLADDVVVLSGATPPEIFVYRQDEPSGTFVLTDNRVQNDMSFAGNYIALGDIDGDGLAAELAVTTAQMGNSGGVYTLGIDPVSGLLQMPPTILDVSTDAGAFNGTALVDVSGDLANDLIVLRRVPTQPSQIETYISGQAGPPFGIEASNNGEELLAADFDGDGSADLITSNQNPNGPTVEFFRGEYPRAPTRVTQLDSVFPDPYAVALGDFNSDNTLDIGLTRDGPVGDNEDGVQIFNFGLGFETLLGPDLPLMDGDDPRLLVSGDFTGDGQTDLLVGLTGTDRVVLFVQQMGTLVPAMQSFATNGPPLGLAAGDVDGDLDTDVVVVTATEIMLLRQTAGGLNPTPGMPNLGGADVTMRALDSQPGEEVVVANRGLSQVEVYAFAGNGLTLRSSFPTMRQPVAIATGVIGDDLVPSLVVVTDSGHYEISRRQSTDPLSFEPPEVEEIDRRSTITDVCFADLNSDGEGDLVFVDLSESQLLYLYSGRPELGVRSLVGDQPVRVVAGDVNGDGRDDLVIGQIGVNRVGVILQR